MPEIISNTSCLIVLDNIGMLDILKELYGKIIITRQVKDEFGENVPEWIEVEEVNDKKYMELVEKFVDLGEASTIALAVEKNESIVILDDMKARKLAQKLNLKMTGTIGIIIKARKKNIITSIAKVLNKLKKDGFRISENLEREALRHDK